MATTTAAQTDRAEQVHENAEQALGFVPNLITEMTKENPAVGDAYLTSQGILREGGVLSPAEQQTVILAVSSYNDCHYCTKAHAVAGQQAGLDAATVETINEGGCRATSACGRWSVPRAASSASAAGSPTPTRPNSATSAWSVRSSTRSLRS